MKKKRVCLYCDHWQNGGVEAYLMSLLRHWDLSQVACELVTSDKTTDIYDAELKWLGVPHYVTLDRTYRSPVRRILHNFSRFKRFLKDHRYDVAYFNLTNSVTMLYARYAKKAGVVVRGVHSHSSNVRSGVGHRTKKLGNSLSRMIFSRYGNIFLACSKLAAQWMFPAAVLPKVQIVPNGIDTKCYSFQRRRRIEKRQELNLAEQCVIGTVGRLNAEKNQKLLLEVFARVRRQNPTARLLLVGDGPLRDELEAQARMLGVGADCIFYGFTDDIPPLLWAMDVFCMTSEFEGLSIAALEAQAAGLPCCLSDGMPPEVVVLDTTIVLPLTDPNQWAEAILEAGDGGERETAADMVRKAGFDAEDSARQVWNLLFQADVDEG